MVATATPPYGLCWYIARRWRLSLEPKSGVWWRRRPPANTGTPPSFLDATALPVSSAVMKTQVVLLLILVLLLHAVGWSATPALAPGDHATTFASSHDRTPQPYRLHVPSTARDTSAALPLLVVLHGWGGSQNTWFDHTPVVRVAEQYGYIVAAPHGRGSWWYRSAAEQDVLDTIADVQTRCNVDPDRVYLAGHSMGGWGTWWIGTRHPDVFAAIAPMSGFAPSAQLANARHLAPFVIHDSRDDVVPVANSRDPVRLLPASGISFQYREETGYGHSSRMIGDNLPRVLDWFNQHTRVRRPLHVSVVARTPAGGSAYWLRLLETANSPFRATIDGMVDTSGTLQLAASGTKSFAVDLAGLPTSATEPLRISIGAPRFETPKKQGWLVLTAVGDGRWTFSLRPDAPQPAAPAILTGKAAQTLEDAAASSETLARAVAEMLRQAAGADVCVIDPDMLRLPPGRLTVDILLDLFVYPDERLARIRCTGASLAVPREVMWKRPVVVYPPGAAPDTSRQYTAVMPVAVARKFAEFDASRDILGRTVAEILYEMCIGATARL